jgi:hypothetical protein
MVYSSLPSAFVTSDQVNHSGNGWSGGGSASPMSYIDVVGIARKRKAVFS